jgi:transcriptional regulator with XRE-family HTH domain
MLVKSFLKNVIRFRPMKFGAHLKQARLKAKLTQSDLARKCGVSDAYLNRVEKQKADPPTRQVCRALARALGVEQNDLWKHAFAARLERWLRREGFRKTPDGLTSAFFDNLTGRE